jgi:DNA-binding NtrC family response regulator
VPAAQKGALIIDRRSSVRESLRSKILESSGASVDVAGSVADSVKHLMRSKYTMIFVDLDMLHGSLVDCMRTLKPTPITIGMAGPTELDLAEVASLLHAVIRKPADLDRIAHVAANILNAQAGLPAPH